MNLFRNGKFRLLYLLALIQLVGGPLVLLQVTIFCKLTLHETPRMGVTMAATRALTSDEFRAVLAQTEILGAKEKGTPLHERKFKVERLKMAANEWNPECPLIPVQWIALESAHRTRTWTPAWPEAPPGPPPRLG